MAAEESDKSKQALEALTSNIGMLALQAETHFRQVQTLEAYQQWQMLKMMGGSTRLR